MGEEFREVKEFHDAKRLRQLFPPELRTASIVPRWSVVWTLNPDTVANHSFYVAFYAEAVATVIKWKQDDGRSKDANRVINAMRSYLALQFFARIHDLDETVTGDIVSPVKDEIIARERYNSYVQGQIQDRLPGLYDRQYEMLKIMGDRQSAEMWSIIKVADRLDALLFLIGEQRMGNGVVSRLIETSTDRLKAAWFELPAPAEELTQGWATIMTPVIVAHRSNGGQGV